MRFNMQTYKDYYDAKTNHRRLQWTYSLGQCSIKGTFSKKPFELQVTTLQAIVMLAFNKVCVLCCTVFSTVCAANIVTSVDRDDPPF